MAALQAQADDLGDRDRLIASLLVRGPNAEPHRRGRTRTRPVALAPEEFDADGEVSVTDGDVESGEVG
jgi:hypothetical protein